MSCHGLPVKVKQFSKSKTVDGVKYTVRTSSYMGEYNGFYLFINDKKIRKHTGFINNSFLKISEMLDWWIQQNHMRICYENL